MAVEIAKIFELPYDHLTPKRMENPKLAHNAQLNCVAIELMGLRKHSPFVKALKSILEPWISK
jgi:hypothetical protein